MAKGKRWFKLDNAGKLYPAISTSRWSSIFRISAELHEMVDPLLLQKAADAVMPRFPSFQVRMKSGLFWYYLEEIKEPLSVQPDVGHPCMPFRFRQNHGYLMRICYYRNRISAEFFHALTDGSGGLCFIKTLTAEYLRLKGIKIPCENGVLDPKETPSPGEIREAFTSLPLPKVRISRKEAPSFHFPATPELPHTLHTIAASMPCDTLRALAKKHGVTLTEYLAGSILFAAFRQQERHPEKKKRPIRISIPVNLRSFFPSPTLRNFSSFLNPGIDPRLGSYTFPEVLREVHAFMGYHLNPRFLLGTVATNVADEKNLFIRLVPLFLKNLVISGVFHQAGDRLVCATLSNLGLCAFPDAMVPFIRRFEFQLGVPSSPLCNCAALTTGNELRLLFSSNIRETAMPREMLRFLVEEGVPVTVESNLEE